MKKIIKKILKESLTESLENDWEWTNFEPVQPRKEGEVRVGDIYTIYNNNNGNIRYVLEIVNILGNRIEYKILVTSDDEEEPVGSIQGTNKERAKCLIVKDKYWTLTQSNDGMFIED